MLKYIKNRLIKKIDSVSKDNDKILESRIKELENENAKLKVDITNIRLWICGMSKAVTPLVLEPKCNLCDSSDIFVIGQNPDFKTAIITKCENCGFIFNLLPPNFSVEDYYNKEYRNERRETPSKKYVDSQDSRARVQFEFIKRNVGEIKNKKILEIGCSVGSLLKLEEDSSNTLIGYEPDMAMSEFASKRICGTIKQESCVLTELEDESFDLIQLSHVFEHFENPVIAIKQLEKKVKKGGFIFIEIPNTSIDSIVRTFNKKGIGHFSYFTPQTFTLLINTHTNLKILEQKTYTISMENWIYNGGGGGILAKKFKI